MRYADYIFSHFSIGIRIIIKDKHDYHNFISIISHFINVVSLYY